MNDVAAPRDHRGSQVVIVLLVLCTLVVAGSSIQRGELGIGGRGVVASTTQVQWVPLVAAAITAVEGAIALVMLLRQRADAARRALYVSAVSGFVGLAGMVLSIIALLLLRREER